MPRNGTNCPVALCLIRPLRASRVDSIARMHRTPTPSRPSLPPVSSRLLRLGLAGAAMLALAACGGGGDDGTEGAAALISVTSELAGSHCASGGSRIDAGTDSDADGVLGSAEIAT